MLAVTLKKNGGGWAPEFVVASMAVVLFSVSLVVGVQAALYVKAVGDHEASRATAKDAHEAVELERRRYAMGRRD